MDKEKEFTLLEAAMEKLGSTPQEITSKRKEEVQLFHSFRQSPTPQTFQPLYRSFKQFIYRAAQPNMYGSPIPKSAHMALAAQSFYDSLRTFDPSKGSLHTHVFNAVREKGKRLNYKYQNIGYIPEARATKFQLFNNTIAMLKDLHGREPSTHEIADELTWSPKMVEMLRKEIRDDRIMTDSASEGFLANRSDKAMQALRDISHSLIPAHQVVLEYAQGMNGKPRLNKPNGGPDLLAISKSTGMTLPKIRSALRTISRKYETYMGTMSRFSQPEGASIAEEQDDGDL